MTRLKIHLSVFLLFILPFVGIISWKEIILLWASAALHEMGHILAYRICGIKMECIHILPFGLCAFPENSLRASPKNEVFCAAAGPVTNLLFTAMLLALPLTAEWNEVRYLLYCNGALFAINILPILPLDGGRILYYILADRYDASVCETVCRRCAIVTLCLLLLPVVGTFVADKNPSLAMIWGYLAVYTITRRGTI